MDKRRKRQEKIGSKWRMRMRRKRRRNTKDIQGNTKKEQTATVLVSLPRLSIYLLYVYSFYMSAVKDCKMEGFSTPATPSGKPVVKETPLEHKNSTRNL